MLVRNLLLEEELKNTFFFLDGMERVDQEHGVEQM